MKLQIELSDIYFQDDKRLEDIVSEELENTIRRGVRRMINDELRKKEPDIKKIIQSASPEKLKKIIDLLR